MKNNFLKIPLGFQIIYLWLLIGLGSSILEVFTGNFAFSPQSLLNFVLLILEIVALNKRYSWGWKLFIFNFVYVIFISGYNVVTLPTAYFPILLTYILINLLSAAVTFYIFKHKDYFCN